MKLTKSLFIISIINFSFLVAILFFYSGGSPVSSSVTPVVSPTIAIPFLQPTVTTAAAPPKPLVATPKVTSTPAPTAIPTVASTPTSNPLAGKCLIYIDGTRYDVTRFRNQHSGGDVFTCGADLSQLFHDRHSNRFLNIMAQFKI